MICGKLSIVPNGEDIGDAEGGWRALFLRADMLPRTASGEQKRQRGRDFERILHGMLAEAGLKPRISFRPPGEEIDGSFLYRDRFMLLEAKWTRDPLPASSIYQFRGKVEGKLVGTIGVFISMSGFSADAVDALVAGKIINTILFDGDDIRAIVAHHASIGEALDRKLRAAAEGGTPYLPLLDPSTERSVASSIWYPLPRAKVVLVEGRFDALLVHALADELGPSAYQLEVVAAGGALNLTTIANLTRAAGDDVPVVIIADGDGDPEDVRRLIERGLEGSAAGGSQNRFAVLVLDPTFEAAIGVFDGHAEERRRVLKLDSEQLLRRAVHLANIPAIAQNSSEVRKLLDALGLAGRTSQVDTR
jgi:hypothetical protein